MLEVLKGCRRRAVAQERLEKAIKENQQIHALMLQEIGEPKSCSEETCQNEERKRFTKEKFS